MKHLSVAAACVALSGISLAACSSAPKSRVAPLGPTPATAQAAIPPESFNPNPNRHSRLEDRACSTPDGNVLESGRLHRRECTLENIYQGGQHENFEWVRYSANALRGFYDRRAERQQRFLDWGATATFTGALGAGLSGRVGMATQRAWLGAAFLPVMLSQQNANEPTRDLYFAGFLALEMISARYQHLKNRLDELTAPSASSVSYNCSVEQEVLGKVRAWRPGDDRAALLPEAQRLADACQTLDAAQQESAISETALSAVRPRLASAFARDVLSLDDMLVDRDDRMHYTPSETVGAMLVSPLRAMDQLLSGQNVSQAIDKLRAATAFENMNRTLEQFTLPPAPRHVDVVASLSAAARSRAAVTDRAANATPTREDVAEAVTKLEQAVAELQTMQRRQAYRASLLSDIYQAAASTSLTFSFSTTTGVVNVALAPPPPPPAPPTQERPPANPTPPPARSGGDASPQQ